MARPCGCGTGGVVVRCGTGLTCTGVGTTGDPLVISWQIPLGSVACNAVMDCVGGNLGAGLQYFAESHQVAAKISGDAGNLLGTGSDGGLLVTGVPDPGIGGVTVAGLPASNVLGGSYGIGYAVQPDGYRESYRNALQNPNISIIHVPVRRGAEEMLYAIHDRNVGFYTPQPPAAQPANVTTDAVRVPWAHAMRVQPSGEPDDSSHPNTYNPTLGYFGFGEPVQMGLLTLDDVFRITARRTVLYLECKDVGGSASTPRPELTLRRMTELVQKWGLQKSVIMSAQLPTGDQDVQGLKAGLQYAKAATIETAVHIPSPAEAAANPPQSLIDLQCTWVGLSISLPRETVESYVAAGLQVMMFTLDRQWHWTAQQVLGARGGFCSDPVYTSGHTFGFPYRKVDPPTSLAHDWTGPGAHYGVAGYSNSLTGVHCNLRGYVDRFAGTAARLNMPSTMAPPTNSGFHLPMGTWCPIYDPALPDPPPQGDYGSPTSYDIHIGFSATGWTATQSVGLFICAPLDERMFDLTAANANTKGYAIHLAHNGTLYFRRYNDDNNNVGMQFDSGPWASGWGTLAGSQAQTAIEYRIGVQVRPGSIRVGPLTANGGINGPNSRLFTADTPSGARADLWRGPYFYASHWRPAGYTGTVRYHQLRVVNI